VGSWVEVGGSAAMAGRGHPLAMGGCLAWENMGPF
jgi:hypothetical protein